MKNKLPENFVYLHDIDASIRYDIKYATFDNILGRPVLGYAKNIAVCTKPLAKKLKAVQNFLRDEGMELFVFELFRPQRASLDIKQWIEDLTDQKTKAQYYPRVDKSRFYLDNYFLEYSAHTRGAAVDLTIMNSKTGKLLDMGTVFDFMDVRSHPNNQDVNECAYKHRQFLLKIMQENGFYGIDTEWWHFNLVDEPFPETYFDFEINTVSTIAILT